MPAGYERIRNSLIAKGIAEDKAKELAAKIWNKYHKDQPVGGHYDRKHMSAVRKVTELAASLRVTPGGMLGNTLVKGYQGDDFGGPHGKTAYPQSKKKKVKPATNKTHMGKNIGTTLFPSSRPAFTLENQPFGTTLLGVPSDLTNQKI